MISVENFTRDLQRYDLHMQHGYPFRYIAWLETQERAGHQAHPSVPHPIGTEIPGEDGVEKSVKRIYTAIHRTPYRARRRPLDTPAQGLDEYACPSHPLGDCPEDCPSLTDFMERFNASAPTATTGRGKEIVSLDSWKVAENSEDGEDEEFFHELA